MPQIYQVKKTRKDQGNCEKCGVAIKKGDPYRYWEFRFGGRHVRCMKPECDPKPSDLTNSPFLSTLASIQETTFDADNLEDLESARDDVKGQLEELRDETQGSLDNMPEGLQQGDTGQLLQERIDALEEAINELDNMDFSSDVEEREEATYQAPPQNKGETDEAYKARVTEEMKKFAEENEDKKITFETADGEPMDDGWDTPAVTEEDEALTNRVSELTEELTEILGNISCG